MPRIRKGVCCVYHGSINLYSLDSPFTFLAAIFPFRFDLRLDLS